MNVFAVSFAIGLACTIAELFFLKVIRKQAIPWKEIVFNLDSGHILMWVFRGVEIAAFALVLKYLNLHWVDRWNPLTQWIFAFFAWDLCFYWRHRMHHTVKLLWAIHVVHHEGEHFSLSLCNRNSWYASLSDFPFVAVLAVLGLPLEIFAAVSSFHYSVQFYNHNGIVGQSGILEKFLITPSHHRVHHASDPVYLNRNFGGTLLIWDKLFGTFQPERTDVAMRCGLADPPPDTASDNPSRSNNPLWASNAPLLRYFGIALPDTRTRNPLVVSDRFIATGGIVLFGLMIYYVSTDIGSLTLQQCLLFASIFLATIAMGALSDQHRWGGVLWTALALIAPVLFIGYYRVHAPIPVALFSLLLLHGMAGMGQLTKHARRFDTIQPHDPRESDS